MPFLVSAEQQMAEYDGNMIDLLRSLFSDWWQKIGATRLAGVTKLVISESRNFPEVARYYHDNVLVRGSVKNYIWPLFAEQALAEAAIRRFDRGVFVNCHLHTPLALMSAGQ